MGVRRLRSCDFAIRDREWQFASRNSEAISRHWQIATRNNSTLFNGNVFVTDNWSMDGAVLTGEALRTKFAAYHYWRAVGFDGGATHEAFASALVISVDGGVLVGRSSAGTLNAGRYLTPGGLVDGRDVVAREGVAWLDLAGAAARELKEETGLAASELRRVDGYVLAQRLPFLAVASVFRSFETGEALVSRVTAYLARQEVPELEDVRCVHSFAELDQIEMAEFARLLVGSVLDKTGSD